MNADRVKELEAFIANDTDWEFSAKRRLQLLREQRDRAVAAEQIAKELLGALEAAVEYMGFDATETCQPYPLERCQALVAKAKVYL